ncbi:WD repeat-containing protein 19-like isoform X3 [Amphibalanus amphitrite]|nr:WD repeat-containing protein 19-like isoform X3 [Amphibalanus amphitrite]
MATTGYNQLVNIYDRMGTMVDQIALPGNCTGFGWDMNGDILAAINEKNSAIILWDANYSSKTRVRQLDSGLRDPLSSLIWSRTSAYLAVGTAKGNLMIYNHQTSRRIPILGKHTRRITCGAWNKQNLLALGGEDKTLSISNEFGDTMRVATLRAEPSQIQFSEMKMDGASDGENTVSFIGDKKSLLLLHYLEEPAKDPIELDFKPAYGKLVAHEWFGDGYILLGFSSGYFVAISSHMKEIGTELFQIKNHKTALTDIAVNLALSKAASCGDNVVKIHELQEMKEIWSVLSLDDEKSVDQVEWSDDGQLLAVGCSSGNLHVYLSSLPILGGAAGTRIAVLTSLLEVTIMDYLRKEESIPFTVDVEPSFLGIGPFHLIVGMNNRAWIYLIGEGATSPELIRDREYLSTVESVRLNADYASILCDGVIQLHVLESESGESEEREGRLFPDPEHRDMKVTCHYLTADFLIYGTDTGQLVFFYLEDWTVVNEYRHTMGIRQLYPEVNGTRVVFVDERSEGHIFNPVTDLLERIVKFPPQALGVLWENYPLDRNVFIAWDRTTISTFVYTRENIDGAVVDMVDTTPLPAGQSPLLLYNGEVTLQTCSGRVTQLVLASHEMEANMNQYEEKELTTALKKNIALRRYKDAWTVAQALDKPEEWRRLGEACLKDLQIEMAMRVYRQMGDVGMLWSLETIRDIEDIKLLAGYVAMFLGNFDQAQTFFLMSGTPVAALEMRRDLLQWEMALQLANKLAPEQIPDISREYAHQLEFTGDYQQALQHYERGQSLAAEDASDDHKSQCLGGIARCSIRCGDIRKGVQLAANSPSKLLKKECAEILEGMKQYNEAAVLFEKAGLYDRAAQMYIKLKNWNKVAELLPQVQSLKIHSQYAKAREAEGKYKEALAAYETAREYDSMVRILLDHLNNPQQAVHIVQESKSVEGARLVAKFFMKMGDFASAIQFLVMSKCIEEAFTLAQKHGKMDTFADIIGNDGRPEDYRSMALHYENSMNYFLAGKFHHLSGDSTKGLKLLLKSAQGAQEADAIMLAIDVVGEANSEGLAKQLIDFLLGEQDGVPKDPKYLFRLYMARKMYRESAKTAVIIAKEEQKVGSYRNAHDMLLGMYQELRKHKIRVPSELASNMMLLHSYILARIHVKRNEHLIAARLLIRVSNSISKFPAHTVPILTSTVIECQRSGLKKSSFQFAATLMKPEYKDQVDPKYKKKIEAVVRKPAKAEEEEFPSPCPFCENMIAETELNCDKCKRTLPYCIASGRHVVKGDLTECPYCHFPAIRSELAKFVESDDPCPMCNRGPIGAGELRIFPDAEVFLPLMGEE